MQEKRDQIERIKQIRENLKYGNYGWGKKLIENYIDKYGLDCYVELEQAKYYYSILECEKAKEILIKLVNLNAKNIGYVLHELGKIYEKEHDYDKAIETYKQIENTNHKNKEYAYFSLASLYERIFKHEQAIIYFEKAMFPHSKFNEDAKLHIAKNYMYLKQYDKAKQYLESIIVHNNPKISCLSLYYEAKIELSIGNYSKYQDIIYDLVIRYPNFNVVLAEMTRLLFSQKKYNEGKKYLQKIHSPNVNNKEYTSYKILNAEYYEKTNQHAKALEIYDDLINNECDNLNAVEKYRVMMGIATCYVGLGMIDKGYNYFMEQYNSKSMYANACLFNVISIEIYRGNYSKAYELLKELENNDEINQVDVLDLKIMLSKFLDIETPPLKNYTYREKLLLKYDKTSVYEHIYNGHMKNAPIDEGTFSSNIDINNLLDEVKEKLNEENIIGLNIFKKHKLYYEKIGVFDGDDLNYLVVITPLYSNDIITMYPTNELLEEKMEVKPKQKVIVRESQIEKFNRRYGQK